MSQRYPPHSRYTPRQTQFNPNRFPPGDNWNNRDRDDRRNSERSYSPARDRRDSRDFGPRDAPLRDLDIDRAQRHPRHEGPASAGSSSADTARFSNAPFRGSSFSARGRGGRDWADRGRPRGFGPEERRSGDLFRPNRSRSPPPAYRDREQSAEPRAFRERDELRRDEEWNRRPRFDDREANRRDGPPRTDFRHGDRPGDGSRGVSPIERARPASPHRRTSPDLKRDFDVPRRQSTVNELLPNVLRRESERIELNVTRPDPSRERPAARPTEAETHSSVAVPQFGSIPLSATVVQAKRPTTPVANTNSPISNIAKSTPDPAPMPIHAPENSESPTIKTAAQPAQPAIVKEESVTEIQTEAPVKELSPEKVLPEDSHVAPEKASTANIDMADVEKASVSEQPLAEPSSSHPSPVTPKIPPIAPRAQMVSNIPPTAPKADLLVEREQEPLIRGVSTERLIEEQKPRDQSPLLPRASPSYVPIIPHTETVVHEPPRGPRSSSIVSPIMQQQRLAPPTAPTGPRGAASPSMVRATSAGPIGPRDVSPAQSPNTSSFLPRPSPSMINGLPSNVPTGPRADRTARLPPTAPRMQQKLGSRPLTSLQWHASTQSPSGRPAMIPAKRDANGDEKERTSFSERAVDLDGRATSYSADIKTELHLTTNNSSRKASVASMAGDISMVDAPSAPSPETLAFDTDDEELDEDDFREQAARFNRKKYELESQYSDLAENWHRIAGLIEESDRLRGILTILNELQLPDRPLAPPRIASAEAMDTIMGGQDDQESLVAEQAGPPEPNQAKAKAPEIDEADIASPDLSFLPYMAQRPPTPMTDGDQDIERDDAVAKLLMHELDSIESTKANLQLALRATFTDGYRPWKRNADMMQKQKDDIEAAAAAEIAAEQQKIEPEPIEPVIDVAAAPLLTPNPERRRNFTSELDLQRIMEESRIEEEQRLEKVQREEREARAFAEREATVSAIMSKEEFALRSFKDTSLLRNSEETLQAFEYAPPKDNFTEEEDRRFREEYAEGNTKMWHKIADAVGRSTKECINHYYATKWEYPYKKQKPGKRRGKAAKKNSAKRVEELGHAMDDNVPIGLTETGRPRRAAAPTFSKTEKAKPEDGDTDTAAPKKGTNAKGVEVAPGDEKVARGRKPAKEKQPRKPRGQTAAARIGGPSPQKGGKDKIQKEKPILQDAPQLSMPMQMPLAPATLEMIPPLPQQHVFPQDRMMMQPMMPPQPSFIETQPSLIHNKPDLAPPAVTIATGTMPVPITERPRSHSQSQRPGPSSYWSVPEEAEFKECVKYYGTDFNAIANHMGKKTPVMIKNHYAKIRSDDVKHADLLVAIHHADERRKAGIPLPPMPASLRKPREHTLLMTPSRGIVPTTEMDVDSPPSGSLNNSPHFLSQGRMQMLQQQQQQQQIVSNAHIYPSQASIAPSLQQKPGRYMSDISPSKPQGQLLAPSQVSPSLVPIMSQAPEPRTSKQVGRIKTEYEPQSRSGPAGLREHEQRVSGGKGPIRNVPDSHISGQRKVDSERLPTGVMAFHGSHNLGPNIRPTSYETGLSNNPQQRHAKDLQGTSLQQQAAPLPKQQQQPLHLDHLGRPLQPQSPASREFPGGFSSQPLNAPPPSQPAISRAPEPTTRQPPAPSRKVNIMSMLNPEPTAEERPRKKEPERVSSISNQAPQHGGPDQYIAPPHEGLHDPSRRLHRHMYSGSHGNISNEPPPAPARDSWNSRPSFAQGMPSHADSPHLQHVQTHGHNPNIVHDGRARDFRAPISSATHQRLDHRGVPSPPPDRFGHSRNPSYTQPVGSGPSSSNSQHPDPYIPVTRGYAPPSHSQGPPTAPRGSVVHPSHPYSGGYPPEQGGMPGGHANNPESRSRDAMRPAGYRRDYDMPPNRDPRDHRDMRNQQPPPHVYPPHAQNHGSPHPQDNRYPPPPPPRTSHTPIHQGYPIDARGMERPRYDAPHPQQQQQQPQQPPPHPSQQPGPHDGRDGRQHEWSYTNERHMHRR